MRWIVASLICINCCVAAWHFWASTSENPGAKFQRFGMPESVADIKLKLLSELAPSSKNSNFTSSASSMEFHSPKGYSEPELAKPYSQTEVKIAGDLASEEETVANEAMADLAIASNPVNVLPNLRECLMLGPYGNRKVAELEQRQIDALVGFESSVYVEKVDDGTALQIYLEPLLTRKDALDRLQQLQLQGIDSYVVLKGSLTNGISLGIYSNEQYANERVEQLRFLGVDPKVKLIEKTRREYWLSYRSSDAYQKLLTVQQDYPSEQSELKIKENFCRLDVASELNIH